MKSKKYTSHTLETLMARTEEDGNCKTWTGYATRNSPQVFHDGKLIMVRKLIMQLLGRLKPHAQYFSTKCENPDCVEPEHIIQRTKTQHMAHMAKKSINSPSNHIRIAKITATKRAKAAKITAADAAAIRASDESGPVLGARYGINKAMVNYIKQGRSWKLGTGNPWQGLM